MSIICYGLEMHQISTQPNTLFESDVSDSTFQNHYQGTVSEIGVHASRTIPETWRIYDKVYWSCSGNFWWPNNILRHSQENWEHWCHVPAAISVLIFEKILLYPSLSLKTSFWTKVSWYLAEFKMPPIFTRLTTEQFQGIFLLGKFESLWTMSTILVHSLKGWQ